MGVVVGEDTGRTFADLAAADARTGRKTIPRLPRTPAGPSRVVLDGIPAVLMRGARRGYGVVIDPSHAHRRH